jgi:hypothetical protein
MMEMVQTFRLVVVSVSLPIVELLELVACRHLVSILLDVSKPFGDPVLNDVGPHVDSQLGLGVLLPVLTAFTLRSFSTVSTSMFSKRLMVGADLGDFVLDVLGASGGSGTSFLLLHVNPLGLGSHHVHLHLQLLPNPKHTQIHN